MKKRAFSLILVLCLLMSLLPTAALAYTGTSSTTAITTYYKYTLANGSCAAGDWPHSDVQIDTDKFFGESEKLATENMSAEFTASNGSVEGHEGYYYSEAKYTLECIAASLTDEDKVYDADGTVSKDDFTVKAYYKTGSVTFPTFSGVTLPENPTVEQITAYDTAVNTYKDNVAALEDDSETNWYVVTLTDGFTLSSNTVPDADTSGQRLVTITYGGKTAQVSLVVGEHDLNATSAHGTVMKFFFEMARKISPNIFLEL